MIFSSNKEEEEEKYNILIKFQIIGAIAPPILVPPMQTDTFSQTFWNEVPYRTF